MHHQEEFLAAAGHRRFRVYSKEVWVALTLFVELGVYGEDVDPFQAEFEHLGGELVYPLNVSLRCVGRKSDQGVEVDEELSSKELGALKGAFEALELALGYLLHMVDERHLVGVI